MGFVLAVDPDVVAADPAFAVEQSRREPSTVWAILTCLRRVTRASFGIWRFFGRTANRIAYKAAKCK